MRNTTPQLVLAALLVLGVPAAAAAQAPGSGTGADFWRWALAELGDRREGVRAPVRAARGGPGPAFCRSGVGHPVKGRAWCLRKGFELGPVPWIRVPLGDVRLGESERRPRPDGRLGSGDLSGILGDEVLRRLLERAEMDASVSFLNGRWQEGAGSPDARILQVRLVDRPLAEISDLDADGRADVVLLYKPER